MLIIPIPHPDAVSQVPQAQTIKGCETQPTPLKS